MSRYLCFQKHSSTNAAFDNTTFDAWGTNAKYLDMISEDISLTNNHIFPETNTGRVKRNRIAGTRMFSGDIQMPIYPIGTPSLVYYALGADDDTAGSHSLVNHVIKKGDSIPIFQMGIAKDLKEHVFRGCTVTSMTLDFDPSEVGLATFGILARNETERKDLDSTRNTAVKTAFTNAKYGVDNRAFGGVETNVKVGAALSSASAVNFIESLSVEMDNNVTDDNFVLGNRYIPEQYIQIIDISGSMEVGFNDIARYTEAVGEDASRAVELAASYSRTGVNGSDRKFTVQLPKIYYENVSLPTDGSDRFILSTDFMCDTDANGDPIKVNVTSLETEAHLEG